MNGAVFNTFLKTIAMFPAPPVSIVLSTQQSAFSAGLHILILLSSQLVSLEFLKV